MFWVSKVFTYVNNLAKVILLRPILFCILKIKKVNYKSIKCFNGLPFILNEGTIFINENVIINSNYKNNPIGGNTFTSFWVKKGGTIIIGKGTKISNSAFVAKESILIGESVYIGGDCKIYDNDFHSLNYNHRSSNPDTDVRSIPVKIGNYAFIGSGSLILKGVSIGTHSVIGAGSVVTKEVPDYEIWAGNPAKFIKKLNK